MNKRIFKYPLVVDDVQTLTMSQGVQFLTVQTQYDVPCLWALVDADAPSKQVEIVIHGTGHPANDTANMQYIGSFQQYNGTFVSHVFGREIT